MPLQRVTDYKSQPYGDAIAILSDSIAREARLPEQRFGDLLASGNYRLFTYVQGEEAQGVALVYFSDPLRFAWLDYFAVRSDLRGRGLGSELFREIAGYVSQQNPLPDWLLFEVDDDYEGDARREAQCLRRVLFYRRLGARVLENVPYRFPSAFGDPIRMRLMAYQICSSAKLTAHHLKHAVREIFATVHGRHGDDELLRWFELALPGTVEMR
jgi:ribosomal protein S18 acetylase RimI-like enzyme